MLLTHALTRTETLIPHCVSKWNMNITCRLTHKFTHSYTQINTHITQTCSNMYRNCNTYIHTCMCMLLHRSYIISQYPIVLANGTLIIHVRRTYNSPKPVFTQGCSIASHSSVAYTSRVKIDRGVQFHQFMHPIPRLNHSKHNHAQALEEMKLNVRT